MIRRIGGKIRLVAFLVGASGLVFGGAAVPARASDGAIEINQARALAGGTTASDTAGYPVTLDTAGRYVLTGNLTVAAANTTAILITASDVTLDLGGFAVQGPCATAAACSGAGGGGVAVSPTTLSGIEVRDGSVRGFGAGVSLGVRSRIARLTVTAIGLEGIKGGAGMDVVDSRASVNGRAGISVGRGSKVLRCNADQNGYGGIVAGPQSIVSQSGARNNTDLSGGISFGQGILVGAGSLVRENSVGANLRQGIDLEGAGSLAIDNVVTEGASTGIYVTVSGSVQGNLITNNSGAALSTFGLTTQRTSYRDNVISANGGTTSGGTNLGGNSCNGTATCP